MNKRGYSKTLIAAHPENRNAVKAGVFSPRVLAPRVAEIEGVIANNPVEQVERDFLTRELAALGALAEAMDRSLEEGGIEGRHGQARSLINLRLRANDKIRQTLERYRSLARLADESDPAKEDGGLRGSLTQAIAWLHKRDSIEDIGPRDLDPEMFLRAVILTSDSGVRTSDLLRARRMLTRRAARSESCVCTATLKARDAVELKGWIDDARAAGLSQLNGDDVLAALVRRIVAGDELEPRFAYRLLTEAVAQVVRHGAAPSGADASTPDDEHESLEGDAAIERFWTMLLTSDESAPAKERLDAFAALSEFGAFPRCTCRPVKDLHLWEVKLDASRAYFVKMVAQKHYRAAMMIVRVPETYVAVREAIEAALLSRTEGAARATDTPPRDT